MKRTPVEIQELAADARAIQASKGFKVALENLMSRYLAEFMALPAGDLRVHSLHASMKAVEDFKGEVQSLINDEKMGTKQ